MKKQIIKKTLILQRKFSFAIKILTKISLKEEKHIAKRLKDVYTNIINIYIVIHRYNYGCTR
jgi:hypothetical protein